MLFRISSSWRRSLRSRYGVGSRFDFLVSRWFREFVFYVLFFSDFS